MMQIMKCKVIAMMQRRFNQLKMKRRLTQILGELTSEGYRVTGRFEGVVYLKHPNGNRLTVIANDESFAYIKNGRLVKEEKIFSQ